jgi:osmotically-inducible protein OsmY
MNPGLTDDYGENSFRGFTNRPQTGRDYEQNIGYRENYNRLDIGREPAYRSERPLAIHKGKGPRTYQRKDERILEDISDRLCDNPYLDASDVEVNVQAGEVILTGTVENRESKRMAEDISEAVSGVMDVENRLHVKVRGI